MTHFRKELSAGGCLSTQKGQTPKAGGVGRRDKLSGRMSVERQVLVSLVRHELQGGDFRMFLTKDFLSFKTSENFW